MKYIFFILLGLCSIDLWGTKILLLNEEDIEATLHHIAVDNDKNLEETPVLLYESFSNTYCYYCEASALSCNLKKLQTFSLHLIKQFRYQKNDDNCTTRWTDAFVINAPHINHIQESICIESMIEQIKKLPTSQIINSEESAISVKDFLIKVITGKGSLIENLTCMHVKIENNSFQYNKQASMILPQDLSYFKEHIIFCDSSPSMPSFLLSSQKFPLLEGDEAFFIEQEHKKIQGITTSVCLHSNQT